MVAVFRTIRRSAGLGVVAILISGCGPEVTRFDIIDYQAGESPREYFQGFDTCYYARDAHGNYDIVAKHSMVDEAGAPTTQILYIRTFWTSRPGRTLAERTMINATVCYAIISGRDGATFEGGGFASFKENRRRDKIVGKLELSSMSPQRRLGEAGQLFSRAEISGTFVSTQDKMRVIDTLNELHRLFGPLPQYDPSRQAVPAVH